METDATWVAWRERLGAMLAANARALRTDDVELVEGVGRLLSRTKVSRAQWAERLGLRPKQLGRLWGSYRQRRRADQESRGIRVRPVAVVRGSCLAGEAIRIHVGRELVVEVASVETTVRLIRGLAAA